MVTGSIEWGLDPAMDIRQYNAEVFLTENGLPQSSVLSILQTSDGYLWMGTYEGIARFDGIHFRVFDTSNTPEMTSNRIRVLLEDKHKTLWIGTSGGILSLSEGVFHCYTTADGLSSDAISCLYEDKKGGLWIGTTRGLNFYEKGIFTSFSSKELKEVFVNAITEDGKGNTWIGTSGSGIYILNKESGQIRRPDRGIVSENEDIRALYRDKSGKIWIGTGGNGIIVFDGFNTISYSTPNGLSGDDIRSIYEDKHGTVWIGTNGKGLNAWRNGFFSVLDSSQILLDVPIRSIIEDKEGNLWIGTRDGLTELKEEKFIIYNRRNGLPVDSVRTVFEDHENRVWVGTVSGGLALFDGTSFKTFGMNEGLKSEHIWTIAQSGDDSLWVGTYGEGLHRMKDNRVVKVYTTENGLSNNVVRALYVSNDETLWIGTNGGGVDVIDLRKSDTITVNYNSKNGLSDNFVYSISGDKEGNTWIGTYYGNLNRIKDGIIRVYGIKEGLTNHAIWSIYPDAKQDGVVWLGTDGGGLVRFKDGKFTHFTPRDGLYSDLAFTVLEDRSGNLWMNCNQGIYSVRKTDLDNFMKGKIEQIPYISFGKDEGIKNTECNGPAQPAGICRSTGELWFPTIRGAVVIDPKKKRTNKTPPPVIIEEIRANGKMIYSYLGGGGKHIVLPPGIKRIDASFTAFCFSNPHRVGFKCKLDGFDDTWINLNSLRSVSYTNIPPGEYALRVVACNNDGVWNLGGDRMGLTLKPFFWQTLWVQGIALLVFAFLSYLMIGLVKKHLRLIAFWKKKKYIGSYEIEEEIGHGGMGVIFKAHNILDKTKIYALKVMKEELMLDGVQKKRFKNESILVDQIDHPNIVKVFERGEDNGKLYIAMELLEGETLAQRYKSGNYPGVEECLHIMGQLAYTLIHLHKENIIHRDLKPENIMLVKRGGDLSFVKILDFGIARGQNFSNLTETGQVLGTISYMPPEMISDGTISTYTDIYSLGILGYEMLTRQRPFSGETPMDTLKKVVHYTPPPPIEINKDIPEELNDLILRMMEKNSSNRPNAREILAILAGLNLRYFSSKQDSGLNSLG